MTYARVRPELCANPETSWTAVSLQNLEGDEIYWTPDKEWVKVVCCDNDLGLYVLTQYEDSYFTCPSIDLEFSETEPVDYKSMTDGEVLDCIYEAMNNDRSKEDQIMQMQIILQEARTK